MSDRFEQELRQALKGSTAKSLEGWEFSPAMRQAVLKRISEEEEEESPVQGPSPAPLRRTRRAIPQPVLWVAAAAAAFALVLNIDWNPPVQSAKEAPQAPMAASTTMEAPSEATGAAPEEKAENQAGVPESAATFKAQDATGTGQATALTDSFHAAATMPPNPARMILTVPAGAGLKAGPRSVDGGKVGLLAAMPSQVSNLDLAPLPGGDLLQLTTVSLRQVDVAGNIRWEQPLSESPMLLSNAGSMTAVAAGQTVHLYSQAGQPEGILALTGPVYGLQVSRDNRVAVAAGDSVQVYSGPKLEFSTGPVSDATTTFAADGALAVLGREGEKRSLTLYGRDGAKLSQNSLSGEGMGLVFADQGQVVVAGGEAFHRSGQPLWRAPIVPNGAVGLGESGSVLLWDLHLVTLVNAQDGSERWSAEFTAGEIISVVASSSGDQVAILGSSPEGMVVWVLAQDGGQRFAELLPEGPADLAVEGDQLVLLMPAGLESRSLSQ